MALLFASDQEIVPENPIISTCRYQKQGLHCPSRAKRKHPNEHVVVVLDKAPCHRRKDLREIPGLSLVFLPPYAPQLNPAERFFEEIRRATANTIFSELDDIEAAITKAVNRWADNTKAMQQLLGYKWIHEQCREVI